MNATWLLKRRLPTYGVYLQYLGIVSLIVYRPTFQVHGYCDNNRGYMGMSRQICFIGVVPTCAQILWDYIIHSHANPLALATLDT